MKQPSFNDLAQPKMTRKAKRVMRKALNESCKEQDKVLKDVADFIKEQEKKDVVTLIKEQYGDVLKRLSKT